MIEIAKELLTNMPVAAIAGVSAGLLRSLAGLLENIYKDGKMDDLEVKQIVGTMIKYFASVSLLMLGLPLPEAVATTFVLDVSTSAIKKIGK